MTLSFTDYLVELVDLDMMWLLQLPPGRLCVHYAIVPWRGGVWWGGGPNRLK